MISEHAANIILYSASVDDFDVRDCFLHFQEIMHEPSIMHQPVVDRLESGHPAQSASAYPTMSNDEDDGNKRLRFTVSNNPEQSSVVHHVRLGNKLA